MAYLTETTRTRPLGAAKRASLLGVLTTMMATSRQRRDLVALDDHLLKDIGVTRAEALQEAAKSRWDAPQSWRS